MTTPVSLHFRIFNVNGSFPVGCVRARKRIKRGLSIINCTIHRLFSFSSIKAVHARLVNGLFLLHTARRCDVSFLVPAAAVTFAVAMILAVAAVAVADIHAIAGCSCYPIL